MREGVAAASTAAPAVPAQIGDRRPGKPRLQALAADLPAQAWLTRLEYRGVLLTLDGLALNLQALTSVEAALTRVAGSARRQKPAGRQRDAEGRWQFSFTLTGARADAD